MSGEAALAALLLLPLAAALLALVAPRLAPAATLAALLGAAAAVARLWGLLLAGGPVEVLAGGWGPPLGLVLRADGLATAFLAASVAVMAAVWAVARGEFAGERGRAGFWPSALLLWGALNAVFVSRDLFNLYVGLELLTLTAVSLVALGKGAAALAAALRYLLFALMGSLVYLLGVVLVYRSRGALDLDAVAAVSAPSDAFALALMTAGLAVKTALFPFHAWLPPAHAGAPSPASALLSALVPKAGYVILLRLWFEAMPGAASGPALAVMAGLGAAAILHGGAMALRQERLKQILAYSTVAQLGYLFLLFPLAGGAAGAAAHAGEAWSGTQLQALSHALAKASAFLCAAVWLRAAGGDRLADLAGLARATPMTAFAFGLAAVSLMGLPPSGGFVAKYLVMRASFAAGLPLWGLALALGGLLAAAYFYRPVAALFADDARRIERPGRAEELAPLLLALLAAALGVASQPVYDLLQVGAPLAGGRP